MNTPAAGKQDTWYVERQLVEITAPTCAATGGPMEDIYGNQMKEHAIAQVPDEQSIIDMAAYHCKSLEAPESLPITVDGDPEAGREIYEETLRGLSRP